MSKRTQPYRFGVPAKYLAGLSDTAARKRAAEIKRTAKKYKAGKKTLFGFFMGKVMETLKGKSNPKILKNVLIEILEN